MRRTAERGLELGKVPHRHRTDRRSTAVSNTSDAAEFTERYKGLLRYYGLEGKDASGAWGNGDRRRGAAPHHCFELAWRGKCRPRGSRDFGSAEEYQRFLQALFERLERRTQATAGGRIWR